MKKKKKQTPPPPKKKKKLHRNQNLDKKVWNKDFQILGHLP